MSAALLFAYDRAREEARQPDPTPEDPNDTRPPAGRYSSIEHLCRQFGPDNIRRWSFKGPDADKGLAEFDGLTGELRQWGDACSVELAGIREEHDPEGAVLDFRLGPADYRNKVDDCLRRHFPPLRTLTDFMQELREFRGQTLWRRDGCTRADIAPMRHAADYFADVADYLSVPSAPARLEPDTVTPHTIIRFVEEMYAASERLCLPIHMDAVEEPAGTRPRDSAQQQRQAEPIGGSPVAWGGDPPAYQFELINGAWQLRFPGDPPKTFTDLAHKKKDKGFGYCAMALQRYGVIISAVELEGGAVPFAGPGVKEFGGDDDGVGPIGGCNRQEEATEERRAKTLALKEKSRLRAEVDRLEQDAAGYARHDELDTDEAKAAGRRLIKAKAELSQLDAYLTKGPIRDEVPAERRVKNRVWKAKVAAQQKIGKAGMTNLAAFLDKHIRQQGQGLIYLPPKEPPPFTLR